MSVLSHDAPVTRFAPSPTGYLHLGHAYAAIVAFNEALTAGGTFLLRMEDIDLTRSRPEFEAAIYEDLAWLGLTWPEPVMRQSDRIGAYADALADLEGQGLVYPCFCSRREIRREISNAKRAPHGPEGPIYPGTCRSLTDTVRKKRISDGEPYALRLNVIDAISKAGSLYWCDDNRGDIRADPSLFGDFVLARKESPSSYHLSVVVDDHAQGVSLVTRGEDLYSATHIHRLLQALLGLDTPAYHHHKLIMAPDGTKFSKRDTSVTLQSLRHEGMTPDDIFNSVGISPVR